MSLKKIIFSITLTLFVLFVPLLFLGKSHLILHTKIGYLVVCSFWILMKNPSLKWAEIKGNAATDKYSSLLIMVVGAITQMMAIVEWSYSKIVCENNLNPISMLGILMLFGGLGLRIWAFDTLNFRSFFTGTVTANQNWELICTGPYKHIRHPSYTGAFLTMTGTSVFLETPNSLITSIILLLIIYYFRINLEEKLLKSHFRELYDEYCKKTWTIFPFIW